MTGVLDPAGRSAMAKAGRDPASAWRHVDLTLVLAAMSICALGVLMVFSATRHRLGGGTTTTYYMERQFIFAILGAGLMVVTAAVDYRRLRDLSAVVYVAMLLILAGVVSPLGRNSKGAQAWFQVGSYELQPSEISKIALIVVLASYIGERSSAGERSAVGHLNLRRFLVILALAGVPVGLIMLQPDLGTALVFGAILFTVLVVAGAKGRHLALLGALAVIVVAAVLHFGVLKRFQQDRLTVFLDPTQKVQGPGFNLNQSKIAIGSGGIEGKGLFKGTQTNLAYVPEQHTDFIFTAVGEELGFVGSALLLLLFALVLWRTWRTAALASDATGSLLCIGVLAMFMFQLFENVGMTMGIMPITGIPLPFMSYGGSAMLACWAGIGLVLNVHMRRFA
jgi:rod shape determining protein RodA